VGRKSQEIKAVLHLPESEIGMRRFEKKMGDFYASQVEKRLLPLPKKQKLEVLQALIDNFAS
jgi:hypothetical protein